MKKNAIVILVTLIFLFSSAWAGNIDSSADAERPDKIIDVEYPEILDFGDQIFGPIDIDSETLDNQNLGVEFDGEYFWVTGGNTAMDPNKLYKLDRDFSLVEAYDQPSHSTSWGWRDMTWDGTYLYASVDGNLDQIDPSTGEWTGETVNGPENPNRALAYDPATDHFWTANFSSAIYEFDRDGDIINSFGNSYSVYGMAWDDVSSDGPWLWVFDQTNNVSSIAWQFDPVAGEYTGVSIDMTEVTNDIAG
ncbi:MAG: hypothetical protein GY855_05450, partial [candidate division Zixibacteria bacterium]|nr:hypothetical protein [candidate division Zixibacteria bacterium]